jgi:aspartate/methionine/tyrosine aminotransferase
MEGLRQAITERTRAVVLVHPNNPTGHYTKAEEGRELAAVCRERGLALIVDEVFLDYGLDFGLGYEGVEDGGSEARTSFAGRELDVLTFVVSGLSKICGLPQMKSSWLLAKGPGAAEALARLEVLADTYLSMNAPVQLALPVWLAGREAMQKQIRGRVRANLEELDRQLAEQERGHVAVNRLRVEGGWYAVLRIPAIQPDEVTALELLEAGVWVHPGHFFGMAGSGWIVVSLLTETEDFSLGIKVVLEKMRGTI